MAEKAAHLVDNVLPNVPVRQWVLTLPRPLRYCLAYDSSLCSAVLACFMKAVFSWLRRKAKQELSLDSVAHAHPGSITVIQRAGSAIDLNVHLHTLAADGVFVQSSPSQAPLFRALPAPTRADIAAVAWDTCQRTLRVLRKRGLWLDQQQGEDQLAQDEPALAALASASIQGTLLLGHRAGKRAMRLVGVAASDSRSQQTPGYGFNLHAGRRVAAHDRKALERLCRYILRPPISNDRLEQRDDGSVVLELKRAWSDGTSHLVFTPLELLQRLVPLIPAPRANRLRYHGCFAPNAKLRSLVVPKSAANDDCEHGDAHTTAPARSTRHTYDWARLMARVFNLDVLECPRCASKMQRIAFITIADAIDKILASVGFAADSPQSPPPRPTRPEQSQPQMRLEFDGG